MKLWLISFIYLIIILLLTKADFTSEGKHWYTIDLFQHITWNRTCAEQTAIPIPSANTKTTAYFLQDRQRCLEVSKDFLQSTVNPVIASSEEITILTAVKQQPQNSGSIISFSSHSLRHFELESSGRRDEIRLHYIHNHRTHTEVFPYQLADNQWHKVALSLTNSFVQLFIDCTKVYERQILPIDLSFIHRKDVQLWVGQRNNRHALFKGSVEYLQIVSSPQGYLEQCPYADVGCPTCSQFKDLDSTVSELYSLVEDLHLKLKSQEVRLEKLEQCECRKSCDINGIQYRDGESWQKDHCTKCTCRGGEVQCEQPKCPPLTCKHPVLIEGHCCPTCFRQCYHNGQYYEHGEGFTSSGRVCVTCECQDGKLSCHQKSEECPVLSCPESQQKTVEGQCCKVCSGVVSGKEPQDYCSRGHKCHPNATCINLLTKYTCRCKTGFLGNEKYCTDINECDQQGGIRGHYCGSHSTCMNTIGSYRCQCHSGYTQVDPLTCREHNECDTGAHTCAMEAECQNLQGGYKCQCLPGYGGDGFTCDPVCENGCQNGGKCVSPGTCQCRKGFYGQSCQLDLDECRLGIAKCHPNSECINIPGDYICECRTGYLSNSPDNKNGWLCQDVNECLGYGGGHQCSAGTMCQNTDGAYQCICTDRNNCRNACYVNGEPVAHGSYWPSTEDVCSLCKCNNGHVDCKPPPCDCKSPSVDYRCCPGCRAENRCPHQELDITFHSGETWTYQCQTCQCVNGETDCWRLECPKLHCSPTVQLPGDCCPRCAKELDPCNAPPLVDGNAKDTCDFNGRTFRTGEKWKVDVMNSCSTCTCKNGHVCCTHNQTCERERRHAPDSKRLTNPQDKSNLHDHSYDTPVNDFVKVVNHIVAKEKRSNNHRQHGIANVRHNLLHDTGQRKEHNVNNNNNNNNNRNDNVDSLNNNQRGYTGRNLQSHMSYNRDKSSLHNNKRQGGNVRSRGLRSEEDFGPDWSFRDRG